MFPNGAPDSYFMECCAVLRPDTPITAPETLRRGLEVLDKAQHGVKSG